MQYTFKTFLITGSFLCLLIFGQSCVSVKAYQKARLNDREMQLADHKIHHYEINAETYREGAAGGNGGKVGGGCGCN